jgi:hypothetical protein
VIYLSIDNSFDQAESADVGTSDLELTAVHAIQPNHRSLEFHMVHMPNVPKNLAAYCAGLLLAFALIALVLAFSQAVAGGVLVRDAIASGVLSPRAGLLTALAMAGYLGWVSVRALRAIKLGSHFK